MAAAVNRKACSRAAVINKEQRDWEKEETTIPECGHGRDVGMYPMSQSWPLWLERTDLSWALWQVTSARTIPDWFLSALCLKAFTP